MGRNYLEPDQKWGTSYLEILKNLVRFYVQDWNYRFIRFCWENLFRKILIKIIFLIFENKQKL